MTTLKPLRHHSTKEFDWNPKTTIWSADASELRWSVAPLENILGRIYDDAIDLGFTLVSEKTGREITVVIDKEISDPDYSAGWKVLEFVPADLDLRGKFKVVVFND